MFYIFSLTYYTTPISQFRYFRQYKVFTGQKAMKTHKIGGIFNQGYMYIYISVFGLKNFSKKSLKYIGWGVGHSYRSTLRTLDFIPLLLYISMST